VERFKIPKKLLIKGKLWKIRKLKKVVHQDGEVCRGLADFDVRLISLEKGLDPQEEIAVLIHELVHAALHEAHLSPNSGLSADAEEIVCDAVADMITECFNLEAKRVKIKKT